VLLMQMANHTGAAGLNLTCASAAYIMEPAMAPAIEAQAAARIYRLGAPDMLAGVQGPAGALACTAENVAVYICWQHSMLHGASTMYANKKPQSSTLNHS
jgi:hypothetical protein